MPDYPPVLPDPFFALFTSHLSPVIYCADTDTPMVVMSQQEKTYFQKNLSESLRRLRGSLSQTEFAQRIGLSQQSYQKYESGRQMPSADVLLQVATTLGVSSESLLTEAKAPSTPTEQKYVTAVREERPAYGSVCSVSRCIRNLSQQLEVDEGELLKAMLEAKKRTTTQKQSGG